jgi:hypothetical protein
MPLVPKQVISPGTYYAEDEAGNPRAYTFTRQDVDHFFATGKQMLGAGLTIPVPLEHQDVKPVSVADAKANRVRNNAGWVKDFRMSGDSLYAILDIPDAELASKLPTTIKHVSPEIDPRFLDGNGREWSNAITHVALTLRPRFMGQVPFGADGADLMAATGTALSAAGDALQWSVAGQSRCRGAVRLSVASALKRDGTTWKPADPRAFAASAQAPLPVRFSKDKPMADKSDLFDDAELDGGGDDTTYTPDEAPAPAEDDEASMLSEASTEAAELGIVVPEGSKDCKSWIEHFITAVKSHKATKANGDTAPPAGPVPGDEPVVEQAPMMQMSLASCKDPLTRALLAEKLERAQKDRTAKLEWLTKSGFLPKAEADALGKQSAAARFSVDTKTGKAVPATVDAEIDRLVRLAKKHGGSAYTQQLSLSTAHAEPQPADDTPEARSQAVIEEMANMVG